MFPTIVSQVRFIEFTFFGRGPEVWEVQIKRIVLQKKPYHLICIVEYTSVSPKKYFAKNLELCEPKNLLFSPVLTVTKLQEIRQTVVS